jgi:hypothetical protein
MRISSSQIIYSEHDYDECFEYINSKGRVPEGIAVGYTSEDGKDLTLFSDIIYSAYDHNYWDNYELEYDTNRIVFP